MKQMMIVIPEDLHRLMKSEAAKAGLTVKQYVTDAIAAVAPVVDAVVAQPTLVAPRADRVGMHAEHPRRLGDGEGGVERARLQGGRHRSVGFVRFQRGEP